MKFKREYFCCSPKLLRNIDEIHEVEAAITDVAWKDHFSIEAEGHTYEHQSGYNRALAAQLLKRGWTMQPKLCTKPSLIGDASKSDIFVEVQFGNSATLYRDYYKFHYGLMHGLLSLAVLIVPTTPTAFFPTRPHSIANMAEYDLACRCYKILPIPVPILIIGSLPEN